MTLKCPRCLTTVDDKGKLANHLVATHGQSKDEAVRSVAAMGPRACSTCGKPGHRSDSAACPGTPKAPAAAPTPKAPAGPLDASPFDQAKRLLTAKIERLQRVVDAMTEAEKLLKEEGTP